LNIISSEPEIRIQEIKDNYDFILMGSDGIFDKISSNEISKIIWKELDSMNKLITFQEFLQKSVNKILEIAMERFSYDNLTAIIIAFENLKKQYKIRANSIMIGPDPTKQQVSNIHNNSLTIKHFYSTDFDQRSQKSIQEKEERLKIQFNQKRSIKIKTNLKFLPSLIQE